MFKCFYPDEYLDSTYAVDYQRLYRMGYKGIIFDIDNTLVPHDANATKEAVELFERLHRIGFQTCLLSNNDEERVQRFNQGIMTNYIFKAGKPMAKGYLAAMEKMNTDANTTLFIGDQLFTDVWGAKRVGIHCILVHPINPKEEIQIVLKRYLEKMVLKEYNKSQNIILIGYMGSGKTTISNKLADKRKCPVIDTDAYIVAKEGMSINEIFAQKGEDYFRALETIVIKELIETTKNAVIATGGGLPLRKENADLLKELGTVIYLKTNPDIIYERVKDSTDRPLLQVENPKQKIIDMMTERDPKYSAACDKVLDVSVDSADVLVDKIIKMV